MQPLRVLALVLCLGLTHADIATNPLKGQNIPPDWTPGNFTLTAVPVDVDVYIETLYEVDHEGLHQAYSFKVAFQVVATWQDARARGAVGSEANSSSGTISECSKPCSSGPLPPDCCAGVWLPHMALPGLITTYEQDIPPTYDISVSSEDDTVTWATRVVARFHAALDFSSFPFDRHTLHLDIYTDFSPRAVGVGYLTLQGVPQGANLSAGDLRDDTLVTVSGSTVPDGVGWVIDRVGASAERFTRLYSRGQVGRQMVARRDTLAGNQQGVRVTIGVSRASGAFYGLMVVMPVCMITLFVFVVYALPKTDLGGRVTLLLTLFLTLIVLQYVIYTLVPATFTLIPPYWLVLVTYVFLILLAGEMLLAYQIANRYQIVRSKHARLASKFAWRQHRRGTPPDCANGDTLKVHSALDTSATTVGGPAGPDATVRLPPTESIHPRGRRCSFVSRPLKSLASWWAFLEREENQQYSAHIADVIEWWTLGILLVLYIVAVSVIFGVAQQDALEHDGAGRT